jgi:hypothetical protein
MTLLCWLYNILSLDRDATLLLPCKGTVTHPFSQTMEKRYLDPQLQDEGDLRPNLTTVVDRLT